jgi:hypothetical protein
MSVEASYCKTSQRHPMPDFSFDTASASLLDFGFIGIGDSPCKHKAAFPLASLGESGATNSMEVYVSPYGIDSNLS